jgi:predicted amidohydrolase
MLRVHNAMEHPTLEISIAQVAPEVGNLEANLDKVRTFHSKARDEGSELVIFPELALTGYTLGNQIPSFALVDSHPIIQELLALSKTLPLVIGYVERGPRDRVYDTAALLDDGRILHRHRKVYLPNYGMWEEQKHFARGRSQRVFPYRGFRVALFVCNDFWFPSMVYLAASDDADVFVVLANSASDTDGMNPRAWDMLIRTPSLIYGAYVIFANRVGNEHGWSFWGGSTIVAPFGLSSIVAETGEELLHATLDRALVQRARDALPTLRDSDIDFTIRELNRISNEHLAEGD